MTRQTARLSVWCGRAVILMAALFLSKGTPLEARWECGNDICEDEFETCGSCPEDCYARCDHFNYSCEWPAEGGGFLDCQNTTLDDPDKCAYSPHDCGPCDYCYPNICDEDGACIDCNSGDGDSACDELGGYGTQWCGMDGSCHDSCWNDWNCHWDEWCGQDAECHDYCIQDNDCPYGSACLSFECVPIT